MTMKLNKLIFLICSIILIAFLALIYIISENIKETERIQKDIKTNNKIIENTIKFVMLSDDYVVTPYDRIEYQLNKRFEFLEKNHTNSISIKNKLKLLKQTLENFKLSKKTIPNVFENKEEKTIRLLGKIKLYSNQIMDESFSNIKLLHNNMELSSEKTKKVSWIIIFIVLTVILFTFLFLIKKIVIPLDFIIKEIKNIKNTVGYKIPLKKNSIKEYELLTKTLNDTSEELKENFLNIQNSKLLRENIIDTVPARIFWKDVNSVYQGANKLFLRDTGFKEENDIVGKTDFDLPWRGKLAEEFIINDKEIMDSDESKLLFEKTVINSKGKTLSIIASKVPLKNSNGEIIGILGIYSDITDKKKIEEELDKKDRLLTEQTKLASMGEMIGNIAHQWRQPLSIISTAATGMKVQKECGILDDEEIYNICDNINKNTQYLSQTIEDFRNFIKGDRTKSLYSLDKTIDNFLQLVRGSINNHHIKVMVDNDKDIKINGYENELLQCIMNIFNNSKDALKKTDENRYIFITSIIKDKTLYIKIKDNAGGIEEEILPRIFEPYFTTKHASHGTGLGLHMTFNLIVDGMKGSIEAKNKEFEYLNKKYTGAEFTIGIPLNN